eukprot:gene23018-29822_t
MDNNVRIKYLSLYSLTNTRRIDKSFIENDVVFISSPDYISPYYNASIQLGPADARFANNTVLSIVELLSIFPFLFDIDRFKMALKVSLETYFPYCGGRRIAASNMIKSGEGVRFSVVEVEEKKHLLSRPPAACLFDQLCGYNGEILTVRIALDMVSNVSAIALSFDHALCDITGASLLLSCISHVYGTVGDDMQSTPLTLSIQPHHDRTMQTSIIPPESPTSPVEPTDNFPRTKKATATAGGGGSVCLQWEYDYSALLRLKESSCSFSRHDAIFADVISVLMATNLLRMETASVSRSERESIHLPGLPKNHFGNGTNAVSLQLPVSGDVASISSAIRQALSCSLFGTKYISFAIGPRTLSSAGRMCSSRGQPNLTVVPSCRSGEDGSEGGVRVYLLAPLQAAHAMLKILRKRVKESSSPVGIVVDKTGGCGRPDPHEKSIIAAIPPSS